MDTILRCECTIECPERHLCEIGTWVPPNDGVAPCEAREAIQGLGVWLYSAPRSTRDIVAAVFRTVPIAVHPSKIDLFYAFSAAMRSLGFHSSGGDAIKEVWHRPEHLLDRQDSPIDNRSVSIAWASVRLPSLITGDMPWNFQRVLEFMTSMNHEWIMMNYTRTSKVAAEFFPNATKEVQDVWLHQAIHDCLYRVGFSPTSIREDDRADVKDDPEWFCDGDPREMLRHNLWQGEATQFPTS